MSDDGGEEIDLDAGIDEEVLDVPSIRSKVHARIEGPISDEIEKGRREGRKKGTPWDITGPSIDEAEAIQVTGEDLARLYNELKVEGKNFNLNSVMVKGCDNMRTFQVEKMFAAYRPYRVEMADCTSSIVHFLNRSEAAAMMIGQTKRLRRVRTKKAPEEGEVRDSSDEEEGELREEGGDDVAVEQGDDEIEKMKIKEESVEINVDEMKLPPGKWRVVMKHVPERRLILVRYATDDEIREARKNQMNDSGSNIRKRTTRESDDGFKYTWTDEKTRPGLNVFDDKGNELDWDYEHDTRFYEDLDESQEDEDNKVMESWPTGVKVRGRGARSARFGLDDSTMKADSEKEKKRRKIVNEQPPASRRLANRVTGGVFAEDEEDDRDTDPTPQAWNRGRKEGSDRLKGRITFDTDS